MTDIFHFVCTGARSHKTIQRNIFATHLNLLAVRRRVVYINFN